MRKLLLAGLFAAALSGPAMAGSWADFLLQNESRFTITAFYTNEGNGWSKNWLHGGNAVRHGENIEMRFAAEDGPCDVDFEIVAADGFKYEYTGDFCKISTLYVYDKTVKFD